MQRSICLLVAILIPGIPAAWPQTKSSDSSKKPADGFYAVQRESLKEKDVLPLKGGEVLLVHRQRYLKKDEEGLPRFLVVGSAPDIEFDLASTPKGVKDGEDVVRIFVKLQPKAATALERLTRDHLGREIAIVLGGEVVTAHKIWEVIKGGEAQITSCAPGPANYLLEQLRAHQKKSQRSGAQ